MSPDLAQLSGSRDFYKLNVLFKVLPGNKIILSLLFHEKLISFLRFLKKNSEDSEKRSLKIKTGNPRREHDSLFEQATFILEVLKYRKLLFSILTNNCVARTVNFPLIPPYFLNSRRDA